jgi:hypothetical protein
MKSPVAGGIRKTSGNKIDIGSAVYAGQRKFGSVE